MRSVKHILFLVVLPVCIAVFAGACKIRGFKDKPYPTPRVIVETPTGTLANDITLSYRMIEVDGTGSDITLQFSTDGGATWQPATAKGGSGTTGLRGYIFPGTSHKIVWDSFADGVTGTQTCRVRITGTKSGIGIVGTPDETNDFEVQNPDYPAISWVAKPDGLVRQVPLTFTWKLDTPAIPISNYYYGLDEDPPIGTTTNTSVTIPAPSLGPHTFRVFAQSTMGLNSAAITATFTCDNAAANLPPSVVITNGPSGSTLDNTPTFEYLGGDADGFVTGYYVSIDVNPPDIWTTSTSWTSPELSCASHTFYVMAQDNEGANSSIAETSFTLSGVTDKEPVHPSYYSGAVLGDRIDDYYILGNTVFAACDDDGGLEIVDISDPREIKIIASYLTGDYLWAVGAVDNYALTCWEPDTPGSDYLSVLDVSDLGNITEIGYCTLPCILPRKIIPRGSYAVMLYRDISGWGFGIVDISDMTTPQVRSTCSAGQYGDSTLALRGNYAYVTEDDIYVVDFSNHDNCFITNRINIPGAALCVSIWDDKLFVAAEWEGLQIYDLDADPVNPPLVGSFPVPGEETEWVSADNGFAIISIVGEDDIILDIQNASAPRVLGTYRYLEGWKDTLLGTMVFKTNATHFFLVSLYPKLHAELVNTIADVPSQDVAVLGTSLYAVGDMPNGFQIYDISDPENPAFLGQCDLANHGRELFLDGNYAYVSIIAQVEIIDISNPASPTPYSFYNASDNVGGIWVRNNTMYLAVGSSGIEIVNVSDLANPQFLSSWNTVYPSDACGDLVAEGNIVFAVFGGNGNLNILDVSDLLNPALLTTMTECMGPQRVCKIGNRLYTYSGEMAAVLDATDPVSPVLLDTAVPFGSPKGFGSHDSYLYSTSHGNGLKLYDILNPDVINHEFYYDMGGYPVSVCGKDDYVYVAYDVSHVLNVFRIYRH
ncbi:MAG: hypothetical protein E3J72_02475 [Planctomycetota bacterium]|nr:MAG: hypothetical protein E3J72_02475 [Planctomycetota bacterium]